MRGHGIGRVRVGEVRLEVRAQGRDFLGREAGREEAVEALWCGGCGGRAASSFYISAAYGTAARAPLSACGLVLRFERGFSGLRERCFGGDLRS